MGSEEEYKAVAASVSDIRLLLKIKALPKSSDSRRIFLTGGTGRVGTALIPVLLERGHRVRALVSPGSTARLPAACEVVSGNDLEANSYRQLIRPSDTFLHLVAAQGAIDVCAELGMRHFIYLSVAHPAPFMSRDYVGARVQCERLILERRLNATILRPWYVLGPGQRWPYGLLPFYKLCELLPFARREALRLGLVTLDQLILALVEAVETPVQGIRYVNVPEIRSAGLDLSPHLSRKTA